MTSAILFFEKKNNKFTHNFISERGSHSNNHPRFTHTQKKKLVDIGAVSLAVNLLVTFNRAAAW